MSAQTPPAVDAARAHVVAAVFAGGALGTLLRAGLGSSWSHGPDAWPWATFVANAAGAMLLGWWSTRLRRSPDVDPRLRPLLATGLCGGLTTFSTLQVEVVLMIDAGALALAATYAVASIAVGVAAVVVGRRAAVAVHRGPMGRDDATGTPR